MGQCKCGFSTDPDNNCNETHKIVTAVKKDIIKKIEAIEIGEDNNPLNAYGMKLLAIRAVKGE